MEDEFHVSNQILHSMLQLKKEVVELLLETNPENPPQVENQPGSNSNSNSRMLYNKTTHLNFHSLIRYGDRELNICSD